MKRDGIRQLGPGKWIVQIYRAGERRSKVVHGTRTDARYERAKLLVELEQRPGVADPSVVSFAELARHWQRWAEGRGLKLGSAIPRLNGLVEEFGETAAGMIRRPDVLQYRERLIRRKLAPATVNHYVKLMARVYNHAADFEYFTGANPAARIRAIPVQNRRLRDLSDETVLALLEGSNAPHARRAFVWLRLTGLRVSELLALRQSEVDTARGVILPRARDHGNKRRGVAPVCQLLIDDLKAHPGVYVIEYAGDRLRTIKTAWENARLRAGLPDVWIHDLRRSFVTHLRGLGVQPDLIDLCVGHVSPGARSSYNVVGFNEVSEVANLLSIDGSVANVATYLREN